MNNLIRILQAGQAILRETSHLLAIKQHRKPEQRHGTWERVDAEAQPAAAMCGSGDAMNRRPCPLRRLSLEDAGKVLHHLNRGEQSLTKLNAGRSALPDANRTDRGTETLQRPRTTDRKAITPQQLQKEIAA